MQAVWETRRADQEPFLTVGGQWPFELKTAFYQSEEYLRRQTAAGVTYALVSPVPQLFAYEAPRPLAHELARVYNQALAHWVAERPGALATVPLADPEAAAAELLWALNHGLKGAIVGPGVGPLLLSAPSFEAFWRIADDRGAIVFIHPLLNRDPRIQHHMLPNLIGVPWETTVAAWDLMINGMATRWPRVKILWAHGGGFLPYQIGRYLKGYDMWPTVREVLISPPDRLLQNFWFDSLLWDDHARQLLAAVVGAERIVPGSDFPFDLSELPPAGVSLRAMTNFLGTTR